MPRPTNPHRGSSDHRPILWAILAAITAIIYTKYIHDIVFITFGVGRVIQPIEDFPYKCERLRHPLLEGCEDMWLDHSGRNLYAACASIESRKGWSPGGNAYNISARTRTDHISVLNIDHPGPDGFYGLHSLEIEDSFHGDLDLHGFDVRDMGGKLRFWLINHKPPEDGVTGEVLDATRLGANSTVEIFDLNRGSTRLEHVRTIASSAIISPNDLAVDDDGVGFLITNDHNTKVGLFRPLTMLFGGGSVAYCRSDTGKCHVVADKDFHFPNGVTKGNDGLFYVAHSAKGKVTVHQMVGEQLVQVDEILLHIPLDNLSRDSEGNIIAAAIPDSLRFVKSMHDPAVSAPAAAFMIRRADWQSNENRENPYEVIKLVEDKDGKVLPTTTVAIRDTNSRRLFLGGVVSPFIGICN
ncbi:calcium-dependent phosphotriesterase [Aspergillus alliaceus]|uniref:calcium-dependent phosphotriesterase n=1 Tax=Petromyces alliaceus TaxID=209559 RepID=UPI0012A47C6C|nr:calcium-dependent phosphotriesterase [Aspergillus alliaceus]KAB8239127.1 calcium-dependent phosphotriesterase [Aspergillus alliaceus]